MSEFVRFSEPVARKTHRCEQCRKHIAIGERHSYVAAKSDGVVYGYREHVRCREAWTALRNLADLGWDDELDWLFDLAEDEHDFIISEFPDVAERLGWVAPLPVCATCGKPICECPDHKWLHPQSVRA